jgi:hypothetical protein
LPSTHRRAARAGWGGLRACVRRSVSCRSGVRPGVGLDPGPGLGPGSVRGFAPDSGLGLVTCLVVVVRRARQVRGVRAAVSGSSLRAVRQMEDSILDSCCSLSYVRLPADRGNPTFVNRIRRLYVRTLFRETVLLRLKSCLKSNQLRPSGARNPWREERLHGKCGDWRTFLSYPALRLKRKPLWLLIRLLTHFRQLTATIRGRTWKTATGKPTFEQTGDETQPWNQHARATSPPLSDCYNYSYFNSTLQRLAKHGIERRQFSLASKCRNMSSVSLTSSASSACGCNCRYAPRSWAAPK